MGDIESPENRPFNLGATFAANFVEVGMVPEIGDGAGESTIAVEQGWSVGDRSPAVTVVFGVECEVHADVLAAVLGRGCPGPWARDHQGGTRGDAKTQCFIHPGVGGLTQPEVVGIDDDQTGVGVVAQAFCE